MKKISELVKEKPWVGWALYVVTIAVHGFLLGVLGSSIVERRHESNR